MEKKDLGTKIKMLDRYSLENVKDLCINDKAPTGLTSVQLAVAFWHISYVRLFHRYILSVIFLPRAIAYEIILSWPS